MIENTFRQNRPNEPRKTAISFHITKSEKEILNELSSELHLPVTEMLRIAIAEFVESRRIQ